MWYNYAMAKPNFGGILTSRVFLVIAALALGAVVTGVVNVAIRRSEIEREVEALRADIRQSQGKNDDLQKLISYFSTPEYREREARLRLGLKKPGENVVVVPGLKDGELNQKANNQPQLPNWKLWYNYFFSTH